RGSGCRSASPGLHTKWVPKPKKHAIAPDCIQYAAGIAGYRASKTAGTTLAVHSLATIGLGEGAIMVDRFKLGRRALLGSAAGAAAFGLTGPAEAQKPLVIGFIYVGPRDDYGYNQAHAEAAAVLKKMPGLKIQEEEKVPETVAVEKTMESMI